MVLLQRLLSVLLVAGLSAPLHAQAPARADSGSPAFLPRSQGQIEQQRTADLLIEQQKALLARPAPAPVNRLDSARLPPVPPPATAGATLTGVGSPEAAGAAEAELPMLPPARPGECFALVRVPAQYRDRLQVVQQSPASESLEVRPRRYALSSERYVQREAYEQTELEPAGSRGGYELLSEQVLEQPARLVWKRGSGPVQRIDQATGDIYCLVEEPAVYRTVSRPVQKAPSGLRRVVVPEQMASRPAARLIDPGSVERVQVPAQLETRWERELLTPERYEWRSVLCPTNMTPEVIARVQQSLRAEGYDPGPVDGLLGVRTQRALAQYQRDQRGSLESLARQ
ncbi:peptidoglycan-binding domain-containing protein [Stagnimonas aquatica]|nr:peptidoglycan-binding domain-containing protein [Stagnimonas aquatica]